LIEEVPDIARIHGKKLRTMLREIFDKIGREMEGFFQKNSLNAKVIGGNPLKEQDKTAVYLELQDYGIDPILKNQPRGFDESSSNYSHIIIFSVLPSASSYENNLQLLEACVQFFDDHHFFELLVNKKEFELSISLKSSNAAELNQFWIARQQTPRPVLFYTARVSAI